MSIKKVSKEQPDKFKFNEENLNLANKIVLNYPPGKKKSAVMALLYIAQKSFSQSKRNRLPDCRDVEKHKVPGQDSGSSVAHYSLILCSPMLH